MGYTRTNLVLGKVLLALGKAHEAVAILEPALRGSLEASNYYVTRTELKEVLADAYAAAGDKPRAAAYYAQVALAWHDCDAKLRPRRLRAAELAH